MCMMVSVMTNLVVNDPAGHKLYIFHWLRESEEAECVNVETANLSKNALGLTILFI